MKSLLLIIFSCLLLATCTIFDPEEAALYGNFWAFDFRRNRNYRVNAELLWQGNYSNIWVEVGSGIGRTEATRIAFEFDNFIRSKLIDVFSVKNFYFTDHHQEAHFFANIMDFADYWLGNGDGRLCILLLDIRDNFGIDGNQSFVGGYFWARDLLDVRYSNRRDMIYIDTNPGMIGDNFYQALSTLAHEMQHLMNFATTFLKRTAPMDLWIDEGLSEAAVWVYSGHSLDRIDWFNSNGSVNRASHVRGLIDQGNNFFVWDNRKGESIHAVLDDYATVYLFFQWLRLQSCTCSGIFNQSRHVCNDIYRKIIKSPYSDFRAVTSVVMNKIFPYPYYDFSEMDAHRQWEKLLKTWLIANYINAPEGVFGYRSDPALLNLRAPSPSTISTTVSLYPGEGVFSLINDDFIPSISSGANIRYLSLSETYPFVSNEFQTGRTLLTFNVNSGNRSAAERGVTTGIPIPLAAPAPLAAKGRSVLPLAHGGTQAFRVGGGSLLRQMSLFQNPESLHE